MRRLKDITINGYKSIGSEQTLLFGDVTVFLGANGSGKSNLISFFRMLNYMSTGGLQNFIAKSGWAHSILHFGAGNTQTISFTVNFRNENWQNSYSASLAHGMPDALYLESEKIRALQDGRTTPIVGELLLAAGQPESALRDDYPRNVAIDKARRVLQSLLSRCRAFQFHDTSPTSHLRNSCYIENSNFLMSDAGNLPAFLYAMKNNAPQYYRRIVAHIKQMVPQFQDFVLTPSPTSKENIFLNWIGERGEEYLFGPHQLSDGSLRYMALTALLLQPPETLPNVIILDEPELGLHPAAIISLANMISIARKNCQIILATQSAELANQFSVEDIVIVDYNRETNESEFKRLNPETLKDWLQDYTLAELWHKNVLGGRP